MALLFRCFVAMNAFAHALRSPLGRRVFANAISSACVTSPRICASFAADIASRSQKSFKTNGSDGIGFAAASVAAAFAIADGHHTDATQCSGSHTAASSEDAANLLLLV